MALNVSGYTDPGVLIGEVVTPAAISIATVPDILGIVAHGNRSKRAINEAVLRGRVTEEALTVSGSAPYIATLINRGDRRITNTTIRKTLNGVTSTILSNQISYQAATLLGTTAETFDLLTNNAIGISIDGKQAITIRLLDGVASVVISGTLVTVTEAFGGAGVLSALQIAGAINNGLAAATSLGYGPSYGTVASDSSGSILLTSPSTDYTSDIQIYVPAGFDATTTLGFGPANRIAKTVVEINATAYDAGATYEIDYVSVDTTTDALSNTATNLVRIGNFAGVTSYAQPVDYSLSGGGDVDWSVDTPATITSQGETYDLSINDTIKIALDGKAAITIDLVGAGGPLNYTNPADPANALATEVARNINAVLSTAADYGPKYASVADGSSGAVVLTAPLGNGVGSSIEISAPASNDATATIFGLSASQLPYTLVGSGAEPVVGVIYFVTYEYDRASSEYNSPKRFFSEDSMIQDLGPVSAYNIVSQYGQIAFENGAPSLFTCQVNDLNAPGSPTVNEVKAAIDGLAASSLVTDVVVADTRLNVQTYLLQHVEIQSSPTEKNYRSAWFGMPVGTPIGDGDTTNSFVERGSITLQVAPDSPARGRLLLVAPTGVQRVITLEDGSEATLTMDSTALACAVAARHTSFTSPAVSLASKNIVGFDINTFPTFLKAERAQLVQGGSLVVTSEAGRLTILDPVTTEQAGGSLPQFLYRSVTSQKDNVSRQVARVVDNNLRGIVPEDLSDFIFDIKTFVGQTLVSLIESGAIGPFRDANGVSRDIDLSRDVQAEQSKTDPTKYYFRYFYFLRYPALRFHGEFSVDNPFFSA